MRVSPPVSPGRSGSSSVAEGDGEAPAADQEAAELLAALRERQPWAAQLVWDRHAPRVRRLLSRALGPGGDVEDLTQEVFLRLFANVQSIRNPAVLREFVMAVAIRVLKWELRRRWVRRRISLSPTGVVPDMVAGGADPEARDALGRCYAILDRLSARERAAFVLRYMEEMKMEEVAGALRVSLSTAKRLVNRAAATVSKQVGDDEGLRGFFTDGERDGLRGR